MNEPISPLLRLDQNSLRYVFNVGRQWNMIGKARFVSHLGDGYLYALIGLIVFFIDRTGAQAFIVDCLLAFLVELPLYLLLKHSIRRPRPERGFTSFSPAHRASDEFSMPSGHTAAAFLFATVLSMHYPAYFTLYFALAGLIGLARVLLGVHYPSDIAAGILLGCSSAMIITFF